MSKFVKSSVINAEFKTNFCFSPFSVEILTRRWKNTRDCYFRALRNTSKRSYIYEQKMAFLLSNKPPTCSRNRKKKKALYDVDDDDDNEDTVDHIDSTTKSPKSKPTTVVLRKGKKRLSSTLAQKTQMAKKQHQQSSPPPNTESEESNNSDPLLFEKFIKSSCDERSLSPQNQKFGHYLLEADSEVLTQNTSDIPVVNMATTLPNTSTLPKSNILEPDPDQAFFDSIKPVMRTMNVNQKLDFQIDVLKLLKLHRTSQ